MWTGILENILFNSIGRISSGLQERIYPIKQLEEDIKIDVRSSNPISFDLYNIPVVKIYFEITNMSQYLTLTFDRLIFDLWLNSEHEYQPLLHKAHFVEKEEIKQKESKNIFCEVELKNSQIQKLKEVKEEKEPPSATIILKAYFDSRLYAVEKEINLENMPCKIEG